MKRLLALAVMAGLSGPLAASVVPPDLQPQTVVSGLSSPVAVRHAGDARLFVVEQGGRIKIISGGVVLPTAFLDFSSNPPPLGFLNGGERGLLGLAFAPNYATSGLFYLSYTDGSGDTVIARYQVDAMNPDRANPASAAVVLRVDQDFSNHNGGDIHFGPDGMLYIGLGDGGSGNDPCSRSQTLLISQLVNSGSSCPVDGAFTGNGGLAESRALLGKLLRIDVSATGSETERCGLATASVGVASVGYRIPAGNPYAGSDGICDEVYASGLRNPWRFSFDRSTGDIWIGDVGQVTREEVSRIPAGQVGLNFGWRCREGFVTTNNSCSTPAPVFTPPELDYPRTVGASITGGFRYRGPQQPLRGRYFYADFVSGRQLVASSNGSGGFYSLIWREAGGNPSSFGEGQDGELYLVDYGGTVSRLNTAIHFRGDFEND